MTLPIYLINLDDSDERLHLASAQMEKAGLSFQRVPAFDGRKLNINQFPDYDAKAALHYMGRPLRGGEIGCYLSHLDCARRFLQSGEPYAVVLEDDMQLVPGFSEAVAQVVDWLSTHPDEWDIVNIGADRQKIFTVLHDFAVSGNCYHLTMAHYFPMTTTGLIWSRSGARAFVENHDTIWAGVDNYLRWWQTRAGRGLTVSPPLVKTSGLESEIAPETGSDRSAAGRHPLYGLMKQRRLLTDKLIALRHKWRAQRRLR